MDKELVEKMGSVAGEFVRMAMGSGLSWDESVAAMGLASRLLAEIASVTGDGAPIECQQLATKRFSEGFAQNVQMLAGGSAELAALKRDHPEVACQIEEELAAVQLQPSPTKH